MEQTIEKRSGGRYRPKQRNASASHKERFIMSQKSRLIMRAANRGGGKCIHVQLAVKEKPVKKWEFGKAFVRFAVLAGKAIALLFWLVFMNGFLVVAGRFFFHCLKISADIFFTLEPHKYLWYTSALWKRNP